MSYFIWLTRVVMVVAGALFLAHAIAGNAAENKNTVGRAEDLKAQFKQSLHDFAKASAAVGTPKYFAIVRRGLDNYDRQLQRVGPRTAAARVNFRKLGATPEPIDLDLSGQYLTQVRLGIRSSTGTRIINGIPVEDGEFGQAVMIQGNNFLCSGVALDSTTVLTAAHCACDMHLAPSQQESEAQEENKLVWVGLSNTAGMPRYPIEVKKTVFISNELSGQIPCPDVLPSVLAGNPDLALIGLKAGFSMTVPQVKIATNQLFNASISHGSFSVVGFGCTQALQPKGRFLGCDASSSGKKFAAIIDTSGPCRFIGADGCSPGDREFVLRDSAEMVDTCAGDSGGPAFLFNATGLYVAGITSRAWNEKGKCGPGGIYENITTPEVFNWLGRHVGVQH
jgi:hypothetical protein